MNLQRRKERFLPFETRASQMAMLSLGIYYTLHFVSSAASNSQLCIPSLFAFALIHVFNIVVYINITIQDSSVDLLPVLSHSHSGTPMAL